MFALMGGTGVVLFEAPNYLLFGPKCEEVCRSRGERLENVVREHGHHAPIACQCEFHGHHHAIETTFLGGSAMDWIVSALFELTALLGAGAAGVLGILLVIKLGKSSD